MKTNIAFQTEDGVDLAGWFFVAAGASGPAPTAVMRHGFSATKEMHLGAFADATPSPKPRAAKTWIPNASESGAQAIAAAMCWSRRRATGE